MIPPPATLPGQRYAPVTMKDPGYHQCMEWKEPPELPVEDRIYRLFLLNLRFDRNDAAKEFSSDELATIEALQDIWSGQDEFNTHYLQYQDAARKYKCCDYMGAWA